MTEVFFSSSLALAAVAGRVDVTPKTWAPPFLASSVDGTLLTAVYGLVTVDFPAVALSPPAASLCLSDLAIGSSLRSSAAVAEGFFGFCSPALVSSFDLVTVLGVLTPVVATFFSAVVAVAVFESSLFELLPSLLLLVDYPADFVALVY